MQRQQRGFKLALAASLPHWPREAHPEEWAMVQNNPGYAYADRQHAGRDFSINHAIGRFVAALTVLTAEGHPTK